MNSDLLSGITHSLLPWIHAGSVVINSTPLELLNIAYIIKYFINCDMFLLWQSLQREDKRGIIQNKNIGRKCTWGNFMCRKRKKSMLEKEFHAATFPHLKHSGWMGEFTPIVGWYMLSGGDSWTHSTCRIWMWRQTPQRENVNIFKPYHYPQICLYNIELNE